MCDALRVCVLSFGTAARRHTHNAHCSAAEPRLTAGRSAWSWGGPVHAGWQCHTGWQCDTLGGSVTRWVAVSR